MDGTGSSGAPNGLNPSEICPSDGMSNPTQMTSPMFNINPLTQVKRTRGLSHACVITKEG